MARLTEDIKTLVVQRLACFQTPTKVAEEVKETYGVVLSRQQVQLYDPTKGEKPGKKWCALFEATREKYIESAAAIGISHRTYRLEALQRMLEKAEKNGNLMAAREVLKQAAEEVGDVYTNKREVKGNLTIEDLIQGLEGDSDRQ